MGDVELRTGVGSVGTYGQAEAVVVEALPWAIDPMIYGRFFSRRK